MMSPETLDLALALLSRAQDKGHRLNKTKLLKLMYLADIEHFRKNGKTLTGFEWIFFLYGPWSAEYDFLLAELERRDFINIEQWNEADTAGASMAVLERRELDNVVPATDEFYLILHQVDTWVERSLPEMLDYIYFETEPMQGAQSLQPLDFGKIDRIPPTLYRRSKSGIEISTVRRLRAGFANLRSRSERSNAEALSRFAKPVYDEVYIEAIEAISDEAES